MFNGEKYTNEQEIREQDLKKLQKKGFVNQAIIGALLSVLIILIGIIATCEIKALKLSQNASIEQQEDMTYLQKTDKMTIIVQYNSENYYAEWIKIQNGIVEWQVKDKMYIATTEYARIIIATKE